MSVAAEHLLAGIEAHDVPTGRLRSRVLERAGADRAGVPLLLVHGNCSSSLMFQRFMLALPQSIRPIAVDLRGYGQTEARPVDATRGLRDWADDVWAAGDALGLDRVHLFGWSMGGGIVWQMTIDQPGRVASLILQAPVSPFGFGGTAGQDGRLLFPDGAGAGGGGANPRFVELLATGDGDGDPDADGNLEQASPRAVLRATYLAPRDTPDPDEDLWVASMLTTRTGEDFYPGDFRTSPNWPTLAPGDRGILNTMAPTHCRLDGLVEVDPKPPVLWLRGAVDQIVADASLYDLATLGSYGLVPGWPGAEVCPPQPMLAQTRHVLDRYAAAGGTYREVVLPDVGHSPHLEAQDRVVAEVVATVGQR